VLLLVLALVLTLVLLRAAVAKRLLSEFRRTRTPGSERARDAKEMLSAELYDQLFEQEGPSYFS